MKPVKAKQPVSLSGGIPARFFSFLAAMLLMIAAAAGESAGSTWEERLAEARLKYNEDTVHVYADSRIRNRSNKINVRFYKSRKTRQVYIAIYESLQITDEAEMEAILEVLMKNEYYSEETHGTISFMKAEWIAHNIAYEMATGNETQQSLAQMIAGESISRIISRSKELDLSPVSELSEQEKLLYEIIETAYGLNEK